MAPEFRLLCVAIGRPERLAGEQLDTLDWGAVIDGALRHRVAPLLLKALDSDRVPADRFEALRRRGVAGARRCLGWLCETDRILRILGEAGIRALVLKGCALSLQLYGDPSLRQSGDIDLLIEPGRLWEADEIILRLGYRRDAGQIGASVRALHQDWIKDLSYSSGNWHLELHHRLTDNPLLLPCDFERLWSEREIVASGGLSLPVLPRRFNALYLCVHGADHGWERLGWLADIAALLGTVSAQAEILADADELGLAKVAIQSLQIAHDWLGLPLHHPRLAIDGRAERRLRRFAAGFSPGSGGGLRARLGRQEWRYGMVMRRHLIRYHLRGDLRYRLRQIAADLASPQDWEAFPLPRALRWLYPLIRPVGWMVRHAGLRGPKEDR